MTDFALLGAPEWAIAAIVLFSTALIALLWSYLRSPTSAAVRLIAAALKATGLAALVLCLVEPLLSGLRPRPGANLFAVAVDDSQSLQIRDPRSSASRGEELQKMLRAESPWQTRLGQDFDVRRFAFDTQLRQVVDFSKLTFDGDGSALAATMTALAKRFRGLPLGGVLLFTDGNSVDDFSDNAVWSDLPAVFPVVVGSDEAQSDISVAQVTVKQTNFETAPVTVQADVRSIGRDARTLVARVLDEQHRQLESQTAELTASDEMARFRFQLRPEKAGVSFYQVEALDEEAAESSEERHTATDEATLANNSSSVAVDNGGGPYRVLYVSGRPNWDFKFLRRALADDDQVELVGLVRIARREPKFTFRRQGEGAGNQLFDGFHRDGEETAERYDEPVLTRLGTLDGEELRDGFPQVTDELYRYDAVILDDVEAEFFTPDQLTLIEKFVNRRGGGLLMLSGVDSFIEGGYDRTPVGDLLPVYLDRRSDQAASPDPSSFRLALTREGWLQDWIRLRKTEGEERRRLAAMPGFQTLSQVGNLKPGATELAYVVDNGGQRFSALVGQRFGRGRSAALLVGDFWRWGLRRGDVQNDDLEKSWRQMVRWLVADVPQRVEAEVKTGNAGKGVDIHVRVHDAEYLPLENANVEVQVAMPDGKEVQLRAEASQEETGGYVAHHVSRTSGAHRATITVTAPDASPVGQREVGWVSQPLADEFSRLIPNRELLEEIATKTDGRVLELDDLDDFVAGLQNRKMPVTEPWIHPLWHHPLFFLFAITCLVGEWGLRRWKGLA